MYSMTLVVVVLYVILSFSYSLDSWLEQFFEAILNVERTNCIETFTLKYTYTHTHIQVRKLHRIHNKAKQKRETYFGSEKWKNHRRTWSHSINFDIQIFERFVFLLSFSFRFCLCVCSSDCDSWLIFPNNCWTIVTEQSREKKHCPFWTLSSVCVCIYTWQ